MNKNKQRNVFINKTINSDYIIKINSFRNRAATVLKHLENVDFIILIPQKQFLKSIKYKSIIFTTHN